MQGKSGKVAPFYSARYLLNCRHLFHKGFSSTRDHMRTAVGVLDVLRVLSGLLLLNALLSYFITGSQLWGYEGKYTDMAYIRHVLSGSPLRNYTLADLRYELNAHNRLLLSINRTVFDVSSNPKTYDPRSKLSSQYKLFVANDCTRLFVNGCFKDADQCTWDLRNTGFDDVYVDQVIQKWLNYYEQHSFYWKVGYLQLTPEQENQEPPMQCLDGLRYPK